MYKPHDSHRGCTILNMHEQQERMIQSRRTFQTLATLLLDQSFLTAHI